MYDQIGTAFSHSPLLAWSAITVTACLVRAGLSMSKTWLFIAACAAPYGFVAALYLQSH